MGGMIGEGGVHDTISVVRLFLVAGVGLESGAMSTQCMDRSISSPQSPRIQPAWIAAARGSLSSV